MLVLQIENKREEKRKTKLNEDRLKAKHHSLSHSLQRSSLERALADARAAEVRLEAQLAEDQADFEARLGDVHQRIDVSGTLHLSRVTCHCHVSLSLVTCRTSCGGLLLIGQ